MHVFSNTLLQLLFLVLISEITFASADNDSDNVISSSAAPNTIIDLNNVNDNNINNDNDLDLEDEVMHETIAAGRGDRDEAGEREEWASSDHLRESSRLDTRKGQPISYKIKRKLQLYRLECHGCDNNEAVAKINAFILDTKRQAERQAEVQAKWKKAMSVVGGVVVNVALCALVYFSYQRSTNNKGSTFILGGGGGAGGSDDKRRMQIEDQRRRAAARQEEDTSLSQRQRDNAPTWVDNEMKEVWTPKQEKQFENAVMMYGRMSPKTRYSLISENVDDKTKQECLMHHKLQQLITKEQ